MSYIKGESEKEHEIRILGNQINNIKFNKDYIDKLSLLLHDSIKYKNYSFKRKNIKNITYKYNENKELLLTLKKPLKSLLPEINTNTIGKKILKNINSINNTHNNRFLLREHLNSSTNNEILSEDCKNNILLSPNKKDRVIEDGEEVKELKQLNNIQNIEDKNNNNDSKNNNDNNKILKISDNVKKMIYNNNLENSIIAQRNIYHQFKNKFLSSKLKLNGKLNPSPFNSEKQKKYTNLCHRFFPESPKLNIRLKKDIHNNCDLENLLKTVNELKILKDKKIFNKKILSEENLMETIKKETILLSPIRRAPKKMILLPYEMFYYDARKWKKKGSSKNEVKNEIHFNEINKKIDETIKEMKNKVISLNQEIFKLEDVRNKMKSQKKLIAIKSKSFKNYKSQFLSNEESKRAVIRKKSRVNFDY